MLTISCKPLVCFCAKIVFNISRVGVTPFAVLLILLAAFNAQAAVYRVNAGASSNGPGTALDWSDAFNNLQDALALTLNPGDQIWVAAGTYKPGPTQAYVFSLKDGVAIIGGFAGTETHVSERDWVANQTILSGDIDNDNLLDSDNSNSVVRVPSRCSAPNIAGLDFIGNLDGFTITGGYAGATHQGGGIWIESTTDEEHPTAPLIRNCTITDNYASNYGAGVFADSQSQPTFRKCKFIANQSDGSGGAMGLEVYCILKVLDCTFESNTAKVQGGGIVADRASSLIAHVCTFKENIVTGISTTPGLGGAIEIVGYSGAVIQLANCKLTGNQAQNNGVGGAFTFRRTARHLPWRTAQ